MTYLVDAAYELVELRDAVATLRNVKDGRRIKRRVYVDLNEGSLRLGAEDVGDQEVALRDVIAAYLDGDDEV